MKEKPRSLIELLELLYKTIRENNYHTSSHYIFEGMCTQVDDMHIPFHVISTTEHTVLENFIDEFVDVKKNREMFNYWWKIGYKRPRLLWITARIKELKSDQVS